MTIKNIIFLIVKSIAKRENEKGRWKMKREITYMTERKRGTKSVKER